MKTFDEYYQFYLSKHQNPWNRRLHILGNLMTISALIFIFWTSNWWLLLLVPFIVYIPAFPGHIFIEHNRPALFSINFLWAKMADWKMMWEILIGKIPF
jgi:hypothetical protein